MQQTVAFAIAIAVYGLQFTVYGYSPLPLHPTPLHPSPFPSPLVVLLYTSSCWTVAGQLWDTPKEIVLTYFFFFFFFAFLLSVLFFIPFLFHLFVVGFTWPRYTLPHRRARRRGRGPWGAGPVLPQAGVPFPWPRYSNTCYLSYTKRKRHVRAPVGRPSFKHFIPNGPLKCLFLPPVH